MAWRDGYLIVKLSLCIMSQAPDAPDAPQYAGGCRMALIIRLIMGVGLEEKEKREPIMESISKLNHTRDLTLDIGVRNYLLTGKNASVSSTVVLDLNVFQNIKFLIKKKLCKIFFENCTYTNYCLVSSL